MKKIILSLAIVGVVAVVTIGGTIAYFSDTETSTGNTFTAGTLDLGLANTADSSATSSTSATWASSSNWAPGDIVDNTLYMNNNGSIAGANLTVVFSAIISGATPSTVTPAGTTALGDKIIATTVTFNGVAVTALQGKTLNQLTTLATPTNLGSLAAHTEEPLHIIWTFDTSADNGCQGHTAVVTLTAVLTQN